MAGNVSYRLSNLDALRGLVVDYENTCAMARTAATINGFLVYLEQLEECEQPASIDLDAVQILTYHGSKGLEWPVVILTDLDAEVAPKVPKDLCKIYVEGSESAFNIRDPLLGRWIRFWPWPFGSIEKDGTFEASAATSPEFHVTAERSRAENTRLMYVGVTRARDILVFAPYTGRTLNKLGTQWLDELKCDGAPVLRLPAPTDENLIMVGDTEHEIRVCCFDSSGVASSNREHAQVYWPQGSLLKLAEERTPYILRPSALVRDAAGVTEAPDVLDIGDRIAISGSVDMTLLGDTVKLAPQF